MDDLVIIRNCPPISALKRFKLEKILKSPEQERELLKASFAQSQSSESTPLAQL
jgi:small subunit ribosomal protein S17